MHNLKIDKQSVKIAEDWHEVTLRQLIEIEEAKLKYVENDDELAVHFKFAGDCFSILSGVPRSEVDQINAADVLAVVQMVMTEPKVRQVSGFTFKGVEYLLPDSAKNIVGTTVIGEGVKFGQYVDAKNIEEIFADVKAGKLKALPMMIALFCTEKGKEWSKDDVKARAELFHDLDAETALGCAFFFSGLMSRYLRHTLNSFRAALQEAK